jgi:hypothetical protein
MKTIIWSSTALETWKLLKGKKVGLEKETDLLMKETSWLYKGVLSICRNDEILLMNLTAFTGWI